MLATTEEVVDTRNVYEILTARIPFTWIVFRTLEIISLQQLSNKFIVCRHNSKITMLVVIVKIRFSGVIIKKN